jgi:hypothetical protein
MLLLKKLVHFKDEVVIGVEVLSALMEWPVDYMKPKLFIYI